VVVRDGRGRRHAIVNYAIVNYACMNIGIHFILCIMYVIFLYTSLSPPKKILFHLFPF
jgi:hypothetical protein